MVKLMKLPLLLGAASTAQAYKQISCIPPADHEPNPCPVGYCVETYVGSNVHTCQKIQRKREKVLRKTDSLEDINNRPHGKNDGIPPEFRNTYTHCAIPKEGVVYREVPEVRQPIVERCWHNPSGNPEDFSKVRNDTVGVNKQNCKLRCPDHRMDPMFAGKKNKITNPITGKPQYINTRVFQVTCDCMQGSKGPGFCGWKTTGSGIKEFAGGNLVCDFTFFAVKPVFAPMFYDKPEDEDVLGNFALNHMNKAKYAFNEDNFEISYFVIKRVWNDELQKNVKVEMELDSDGMARSIDDHANKYTYEDEDTFLQMFPTDLVVENESGKNENQHNKVESGSVNVRAKVRCRSHTGDRFFFTFFPWCKNKRHTLKKGRPGDCGWRIESMWPNHADSIITDKHHPLAALGFDPDFPKQGKASKYKGSLAKSTGIGNKKATVAIQQIQKGNKYWRCPDFVENSL